MMAKIVQDFSKGVMNQDVDKRLLPNGMLRSVTNGRIIDTDGDNSGVIESIGGTEEILKEPFLVDERGNVIGKILGSAAFEDEIYCIGYGEFEYDPSDTFLIKSKYLCRKESKSNTGDKIFSVFIINGNGLKDISVKLGRFEDSFISYTDNELQEMTDELYNESISQTIEYIKEEYKDFIDENKIIIQGESVVHDEVMCPLKPINDEILNLVTHKDNIVLRIESYGDDITISWGDGNVEKLIVGLIDYNHIYDDGIREHAVLLNGNSMSLSTFNCNDSEVSELNIIKADNLIYLGCFNNQLTQLDISACSRHSIDVTCFNNQLTQLYLNECHGLKSLNCSYNQLTELDVSDNLELTRLDCSNNQLSQLDVSKNIKLDYLGCFYNQLTRLDVSGCVELLSLACESNQLSQIDVSNNQKLNKLDCSKNQLIQLNVSMNTKLDLLHCDNNELNILDISKNILLKELKCGHNHLEKLDASGLLDFEICYCEVNPLITNNENITTLATSLVDRTDKEFGGIYIENVSQEVLIQPICNAKNWLIIQSHG